MARVTRITTATDPAAPAGHAAARRGPDAVAWLAGAVIVASVAARVTLLDRQSYWGDELFSVNQSAGSFGGMTAVGATEVHPPLYTTVLWAWIELGGPGETWTRLLSTLCAVAAVVVTHRGLRGSGLAVDVRRALTAATAAGGTSMIYSLETRSYAPLLLGVAGVTAATLRAAAVPGAPPSRRTLLAWAGWGTFTATVHLFGAFLTAAAAAVLAGLALARRPGPGATGRADTAARRAGATGRGGATARWAGAGMLACLPQAGWLLLGAGRPGFAGGTRWIRAPGGDDVRLVLTTAFGSGGMTPLKDGFAWASPAGVLAAAAGCALAGLAGLAGLVRARAGRRGGSPGGSGERPGTAVAAEARAAAVLLGVVVLVVVPAFVVSRGPVHLWTLRNLAVVAPPLVWGAICLAAAATRTARGARVVAAGSVVLLGLGLVPVTAGLARPYKMDFRGLMGYLFTVRAEDPDALFVFFGTDPPTEWHAASRRDPGDPAWGTLYRRVAVYPVGSLDAVPRVPSTEIVVFHRGVADPRLDRDVAAMVARLGTGCRRVPLYGLGVVRCDAGARE